MRYIRLFDTETNYNTAKDGLEYPTVSLVQATDELKWMKKHDYSQDYLTFEALEDNTVFSINLYTMCNGVRSISYSTDNGTTWTTTINETNHKYITTPSINRGDKILWKGEHGEGAYYQSFYDPEGGGSSYWSRFVCNSGSYKCYGNIMSLSYGDNFRQQTTVRYTQEFFRLFGTDYTWGHDNGLRDAENLILPATTLSTSCYGGMFEQCLQLAKAPALPATALAQSCYATMFHGCPVLTTAPDLPATTLAASCYNNMFNHCTVLTKAPALPATTLAQSCYATMFYQCTSLTTAPDLPATTLAANCYHYMFSGCSNLNYIKAMFTTTPSTSYTQNWVSGVAANGTFVKNVEAQWNVTGNEGIPSGWTVETASE